MMRRGILLACLLLLAVAGAGTEPAQAGDAPPLYANNFEKAEAGKAPDDFLILDGGFAVREEGGNKFLELPGAPLDTFGALFGPTVKPDVAVSARVFGTGKGRRFPTFGVGVLGQSGYKLQVSPGKRELELYRGDDVVAQVPYEWKSGHWTWLRLQVTAAGGGWLVEGKAWMEGGQEPEKPAIVFTDKKEPGAGRCAVWGSPYSTTPIRFDDLLVAKPAGKQ